jgi:hypothetical protein
MLYNVFATTDNSSSGSSGLKRLSLYDSQKQAAVEIKAYYV